MNGHGHNHHGILLLQDLEDEEADLEYQTNYSSSTTSSFNNEVPSTSSFQHQQQNNHFHQNGTKKMDNLSVPKKNYANLEANPSSIPQFQNPKPILTFTRRKSVSAEPPWNSPTPNNDPTSFYQNGYLSNNSNSSMSLTVPPQFQRDNAITVAPSRNSLLEPNVFAGGRATGPNNNNNHHHHKQVHHRKHKGRSKSPSGARTSQSEGGSGCGVGSILDRIDNSILKKFGDWSNMDQDEGSNKRGANNGGDNNVFRSNNTNNSKNIPYYIPKRIGSLDEDSSAGMSGSVGNGGVGLPKLYKNYDTVVKNSKLVLTDKSYKIALSKDNNDPNSILSEAKRTLSRFGGQEFD